MTIVAVNVPLKMDPPKKDLVEVGRTGRRKTKEKSQYRSHWLASVRRKGTGYPAVAVEGSVNDLREARGHAEAAESARRWRGRKRD